MANPTIKSISVGTNTGTTATVSVTTSESPSVTSVGDLVVLLHENDFYGLANMQTPPTGWTVTGSPTLTAPTNGSADGGANLAHIKSYTYTVNTSGAQTISTTETGSHDEEKALIAIVIAGADTSTPIDGGASGAAGSSGAASTSWIAPAVSPTGTDALLICVACSGGGGSGAQPFTPPSGMTEQLDGNVGALAYTVATLGLSASGSTGTKTFTATAPVPFASLSLAIKSAAAGAAYPFELLTQTPRSY